MTEPGEHLRLRGLSVQSGARVLLRGVDLELAAGRLVALVGASGSGKTLTARAMVGLVGAKPGVVAGRLGVQCRGQRWDVNLCSPRGAFAALRGAVLTWQSQHAHAALDPLWTVRRHLDRAARGTGADPLALLRTVGFDHPEAVLPLYPHALSGGMAQRVAVAQALARGARFLLADEPTTALDPTAQHQVLSLLGRLRDEGAGVLLITHDLRIVPRLADEVVVMDQGVVVERLAAARLWDAEHPVTRRLLAATAAVAGGAL